MEARESLARVAYVTLPNDAVFISFSSDAALPLIWRGLRLEPGEILLHGRGERLHQRTLGPSSWGLIWLPPASLAAFGKTVTGRAFAAPDRGKILRPSVQDRKHLLHIHAGASRLAGTKPRMLAHPEVMRAMEQELVGVLISCLTNSEERVRDARYASGRRHHGLLRRDAGELASQNGGVWQSCVLRPVFRKEPSEITAPRFSAPPRINICASAG